MQPFVLYNSEQRKKVEFVPRVEGQIDIYVCGMTVYDYCHIGHARVMVAFDYIIRFLRSQGWQVKYVRNITDIDDKIIQRANENGENIHQLTDRFIDAMNEDFAKLGCLAPDEAPKATDYINQMQNMIGTLVEKGTAYPANNGDVYFEVEKFAKYGRLSGRKLEDMQAGASERVDVEVEKKHPFDFVLWKHAKENEPSWASPWGNGRPGWHIECSAMSTCCLGNHFDIHGGGADLSFPHHENEIAQSEAKTGHPFARYWMHNGFVTMDNEKMSKSLGNFVLVHDIIQKVDPQVLRFFLASTQYRRPINYSMETIEEANHSLNKIKTAYDNVSYRLEDAFDFLQEDDEELKRLEEIKKQFIKEMDDDINAANGMTVIFEMVRQMNIYSEQRKVSKVVLEQMLQLLSEWLHIFGITFSEKELLDERIEQLIQERNKARAEKNFQRSDEVRDLLKENGIILEDTAQGTRWKRG